MHINHRPIAAIKDGLLLLVTVLALTFYSSLVLSHADHDKARFVAATGVDSGKCDDAAQPCKTINYAGLQSNKGDTIRMAAGNYKVEDVDTLFYLLSDLVPVKGLYSEESAFAKTDPNNITRLTGVPLEFADKLASKGFTVIVDAKGLDIDKTQDIREKMQVYERLKEAKAATNCENGFAGDHACENMDLLSHVPLSSFSTNPSAANDVWGFYDVNDGREYAIMGLRNGVGVVEVTNPESPRMVGSVSSQSTSWRDIKVYQHFNFQSARWESYAYVTADSASVGTMIIDLRSLPETISVAGSDSSDISAHNVYLSNVDYSLGVALNGVEPYLHISGSNRKGGSFNTYGLDNPQSPVSIYQNSSSSRTNYTHDVSSMVVTDERKDTQCVSGGPHCEIFFDFNEDNFQIWDKTQNSAPARLSTTSYKNVSYVHSGWYTEDKQVVLVHDELDEMDYGLNTTVRLFEMSDFRAPSLLSTWTGPTGAIDHNGFVRGNRYYMSNYTRGMTVLDISDTSVPKEIGFFDTFPMSDNTSFNGAWGVYPYLPSGVVLISDISSGLYVVRDNTLQTAEGNASFDAQSYLVEEGGSATVEVARNNGTEGAVSVKWEILAGATDGDDLSLDSGTLSWGDGESQVQSISIPVKSDSNGEPKESFFIRLHDPVGSLSLASPSIAIISIEVSEGVVQPEENEAPVVDAGADMTVNTSTTVNLQGSATDADSSVLTYAWEQLTGTTVSIGQSNEAAAQFTAPGSAGELSFRLTVTDDLGGVGTDTVAISVVVAALQPPVVLPKSGGGGCTIATDSSRDSSLVILMLATGLLMARRRYWIRQK
ncbi:MAG TPA: choice-of-anchor B family protein [Porticoccaceae bacterium]|nr:choice-of-anchor B family protein [Porticoccaceae bacterium]